MSRYSTPTSDLGNLGLGGSSSGDMPVQTRAMSRRGGQDAAALQAAYSSRVQAGPSRRQAAQSGQRAQPSHATRDDDNSDGSQASSDESSEEEQNQPAQLHEILSIYDPGLATPRELDMENGPDPNTR